MSPCRHVVIVSGTHTHALNLVLKEPELLGITVVPGAPSYQDEFVRRDVADNKIKDADLAVQMDGLKVYIDLNVTGPQQVLVDRASKSVGAMAMAGETTKISNLKRHYHVSDAVVRTRFVPFVVEPTGAFGERARGFMKKVVGRFKVPEGEEPNEFRSRVALRYQEQIAAAVQQSVATQADYFLSACGVPSLHTRR